MIRWLLLVAAELTLLAVQTVEVVEDVEPPRQTVAMVGPVGAELLKVESLALVAAVLAEAG